ncbi:MAG: phosphomannomutase [Alphaproteobacteria bacterium]|nr:phosphomannomutase [Alphaproteobacteria bacterium]
MSRKKITHFFDETIIREYDIRGIYEKTLFDLDAKILGNLFGLKLGKGESINIAYDGRISSNNLKENLIKGFLEVGVNVNEIGLGPTPMLYYSCVAMNVSSGIIVTGSHNPKNHNGFKVVYNNLPFFADDLQKLKEEAKGFVFTKTNAIRKNIDVKKRYLSRLLKSFIQKKDLNIVWDAGNGSAGEIMKNLSDSFKGKKIILFEKIDGNFPNHHPDPSDPKNLEDCQKYILKHKLDVGLAFDGDGDRLGVVDDKGRIIPGDKILLLLAKQMLKKKKIKVIADVKCSQVLFDQIKNLGGEIIMSQTGHSHVKNNLKKFNAHLAGEMSGHIFFAEGYYGFDDALYAAVKILEVINENEKKLSELVDEIPNVFNTPEIRIECDDKFKFEVIKKVSKNLEKENKKIINIDGLRVLNKDGWWLLRASNTQPALVVRCESSTKDGLKNQKKNITEQLNKIDYNFSQKIFG